MNTDLSPDSNLEVQAAEWVVSLHYLSQRAASLNPPQVTAERNAQFVLWLRQSARHVAAFMRADDEFCRLEGIDPKRAIDIDKLLRGQLFRSGASRASPIGPTASRRLARPKIAMVALLVVAVSAIFGWSAYQHAHVFATGVGEQRVVKLPDGSTMTLNTSSRVSVDFSTKSRRIHLDEGEALFSVEHDSQRPFLVLTPTAVVRAVGTQFDVYQHANATTTITVLEGVVRFASMRDFAGIGGPTEPTSDSKDQSRPRESAAAATGTAAPLGPGQQAHIVRDQVTTSNDANAPDEIAWRDRLLVFRGKPLSEVADEFNRYNTAQIRILDSDVGQLRMSGTYSVDRPQILALFLREDHSLDVSQQGNEWIVRKR
jgi:transmembrane sensor